MIWQLCLSTVVFYMDVDSIEQYWSFKELLAYNLEERFGYFNTLITDVMPFF